jgi:hypothetical protein
VVPSTSQPAGAGGRSVEFTPGVRIDWTKVQVELAGRVVLREGLLELLACSPGTREHESIVRVNARPLHIFQALGLIGLEPGRPVTYEEAGDRWLPAAGAVLVIEVRYAAAGRGRTVNIWDWVKDARTNQAPPRRDWLFCGSRFFPEGPFGADADGTVICVVDFDTALIGLAEPHSADNAALWLAANPDRIPPEGTKCTLLIRAAGPGAVVIECADRGRFRLEGRWLNRNELLEALATRHRREPELAVTIRELPGAPPGAGRRLLDIVRGMGIKVVRLQPPPGPPTSQPGAAAGPG